MKYDRTMRRLSLAPMLMLCALLAGCVTPAGTSSAVLQGDSAHPATTQAWVVTRLYFGLGPAAQAGQGVSEQAWRDFLDREVTARFPDGLSVFDAYGQWQDATLPIPERLRSKVLEIAHPDTPQSRAKVEAIRAAWKQRTGDQSVLRVTQPADVSF